MNAALPHSDGDIIVVFDADHAPVPRLPARDGRLFPRRSETVPGADAARLSQSRSDREEPAHVPDHAVRERDVLFGHAARARQVERLVLLRLGGAAAPRGAASDGRLLRRHHHGGLRDRVRAARQGLEQRLCRQAADRRPAAGDVRVLHRPALALVPGHVPDPAAEEPGAEARPEADPAARLSVEHDVLVLPVPAADVHVRAAALHLLQREDLRRQRGRRRRLHAHLHDREHDDAELSVRPRALAVGVRALRICAGRVSRQGDRHRC